MKQVIKSTEEEQPPPLTPTVGYWEKRETKIYGLF